MPAAPRRPVGVIGPGRAGAGLALALSRAGYPVRLHGRRAVALPAPLALSVGPAGAPPPWIAETPIVLCAVPDQAIGEVAAVLAAGRTVGDAHVVLHLSGVYGQEALGPLVSSGAALGSLHPLQTLADPARAPERLRGAWAAVEGMARAVDAAEALARDVGLRPFRLAGRAKPLYHAGAVFASNYLVVIEAVAQRLLRHAGLSDTDAWQALRPLLEGTLENLAAAGPVGALTGPVVRGDEATVRRHRAALTADDAALYTALGRAALALARTGGMPDAVARRVADALATGLPPELPPAGRT